MHRILFAFALVLPVFPAIAESPDPEAEIVHTAYDPIESDASDRINLAGELSMLTQRVAASSCALTSDVAVEESYEVLETSTKRFERIVAGLRDGDEELHLIQPETNRRLLHDLEELWTAWAPVHDAVEAIMVDTHDVDSAHIIDDQNVVLMERAEVLISDISGTYSAPYELNQIDAILIKLAGRQRMLTQKMAKDACEIWTHYHEEAAVEELVETKAIFEQSMAALRDGMPAMGLPPAPTPEIAADVERILTRWETIRGNLDTLLETRDLDQAGREEVFHDLNVELAEIDLLVAHYTSHAERHHDSQ